MKQNKLIHIGRNTLVDFKDEASGVPAKIDTGADSTSVWASNIRIDKQGKLCFTLFDKQSEFYTGKEIVRPHYRVAKVKSSNGHEQVRYRAELVIRLKGKTIRTLSTLADRSNNAYPVLIGRRTLQGRFIVDVSRIEHIEPVRERKLGLNDELKENPHEFHKKYHG
ncbi:MAG: RimK/LysX family protein [Candidatus Saccharibacteria bacterium]